VATGTPDVTFGANVPSRESKEYRALMEHLGCPAETIEADVVRPHWPHLADYLTRRASEGKPPPPGIDPASQYPVYSVGHLRTKRGVTID
jgi:hypothetical protein